jgi:hypothetical protein
MIERDWRDYDEKWTPGDITDEAISHPAKFNRGLIKRIYMHLLQHHYVEPGQTILDPFGGVALGAADALQAGLNWVGVELEQNFADMSDGCDCTGMSKADWRRFYGRWGKAAYTDGRHWCPRCLAQAGQVSGGNGHAPVKIKRLARIAELEEKTGRHVARYPLVPFPGTPAGDMAMARQSAMFGAAPSTAYRCNSGEIPHSEPHHYTGNVELFARHARGGATAILLHGDSRQLRQVVAGAGATVSSPSYVQSLNKSDGIDWDKAITESPASRHQAKGRSVSGDYGPTPSNLGNLPPGRLDAVLSSMPYADSVNQTGVANDAGARIERKARAGVDMSQSKNVGGPNSVLRQPQVYGNTPGQLGAMHVCGSPPYAESLSSDDPDKRGGLFNDPKRHSDRTLTAEYGSSAGQLGRMHTVTSPPFGGKGQHTGGPPPLKHNDGRNAPRNYSGLVHGDGYSTTPENLGNLDADVNGNFWEAASTIMSEVAAILEPGAYATWVCKSFVRDGAIVDFPDQWRQLGEAHGFETVEWIWAHLVEERGTQMMLDGGVKRKRTARKSFFRNLYEQKHPENAIDFEVVIIQRKNEPTCQP